MFSNLCTRGSSKPVGFLTLRESSKALDLASKLERLGLRLMGATHHYVYRETGGCGGGGESDHEAYKNELEENSACTQNLSRLLREGHEGELPGGLLIVPQGDLPPF